MAGALNFGKPIRVIFFRKVGPVGREATGGAAKATEISFFAGIIFAAAAGTVSSSRPERPKLMSRLD